jgi:hypothetical protein
MAIQGRAAMAVFLSLATGAAAFCAGPIWRGVGGPYIGVDFTAGTPSAMGDVFRAAFPGASLRFIASPRLEFSLDYAFMETGYYYPESGSGPWTGPIPWSSMPGKYDGLEDSWIFYHTKHFISPQVWYLAPLEDYGWPLAIRLGAGPAISLIVPSESATYYPGLSGAYKEFESGFKAFLGLSLRAGLEYRPWPWARLGLEYLFVVDSLVDMAANLSSEGLDFVSRAGNFVVFTGIRI